MQTGIFKLIKPVLLSMPLFLIFGCGIWGDFTTYFNLYYNASDIFNQAEEAINQQQQDLFSNEDVTVPGSAVQLLNKVIEKCSAILQFHSESAYVDDALIMLGKSFYYQKNYQKALRKFQELIATQKNSGLITETNLWIGKTEMKLKEYRDALSILDAVIKDGIDNGKNKIVNDAYIEEIKYKLSQDDYAGAISSAKELLKVSDDNEINAKVVYETGLLYNLLNDPQNAIASFQKVFDYSPNFDTELNAKIELAKAYRSAEQPEGALDIFTDLRSEKNYSDSYDVIDLETGITQVDLKNYNKALSYFNLVDTGYTRSKSTGIAKYKLGELYQYHFFNYDSASYYYSKSLTSTLPPDYIQLASDKVQKFKKYKTLKDNISQNQKKLEYIQDPETFVKDSIAFYSDTVKTETNTNTESNSLQSGFNRERFGNRDLGEINRSQSTAVKTKSNVQATGPAKIPPIRPNISEDSIKSFLSQNLFELGNLFFTEFDLPDSAYKYYMMLLENYPDSKYQARTLYSLGSYYQTINEFTKADSLFNIIYNHYKNESIVNAAANKLGKPLIDLNYDPAVDLYASAEKKFMNENYKESLNEFYNIYKNYPASLLAPKALYTTGWILENQLDEPDSAAIFYDTLTAKYPGTPYAIKINPQISFYNQEQARIKKAYEDSIKAVETARLDSLKADSLGTLSKAVPQKSSVDSTLTIKNLPGNSLKTDTLQKNNITSPILKKEINNNRPGEKMQLDTNRAGGSIRREEENKEEVDTLQKNLNNTLDSLKAGRSRLR
jgi:tetratricopeptide (TPR) repeat protein